MTVHQQQQLTKPTIQNKQQSNLKCLFKQKIKKSNIKYN